MFGNSKENLVLNSFHSREIKVSTFGRFQPIHFSAMYETSFYAFNETFLKASAASTG